MGAGFVFVDFIFEFSGMRNVLSSSQQLEWD